MIVHKISLMLQIKLDMHFIFDSKMYV